MQKIHSIPENFDLAPKTGLWTLVAPQYTSNHFFNPGFEGSFSLGSLTIQNCTTALTTTAVEVYRGKQALKITPTSTNNFVKFLAPLTLTSIYWAWSIYIKGTAGEQFSLQLYNETTPTDSAAPTLFIASGQWQRVTHIGKLVGFISTYNVMVKKLTNSNTPYCTDCWQLEPTADNNPTTYIDGDMETGGWQGTPYASRSIRQATSFGGREYTMKELGFRVKGYSGSGLPDMDNKMTKYASLGGSYYNSTTAQERITTLIGAFTTNDMVELGLRRLKLTKLVAPEVSTGQAAPLMLKFTPIDEATGDPLPTAREAYQPCYYAGGLEARITNRYQELVSLQFIEAQPPSTTETRQLYLALPQNNLLPGTPNYFGRAIAGDELGLRYGTAGATVYCVATDKNNGYLIGYNSGFVFFDIYGAYAAGTPNNNVLAALLVSKDDYYIAGAFTTPFSYLAHYVNGVASAVGTNGAFNGSIQGLCFDANGMLVAVGNFTAPASYAAWYNTVNSTWTSFGTFSGGTAIYCVVRAPDGSLIVGGNFTTAGGVACKNIARYSINPVTGAGAFTPFGSGSLGIVRALAVGPDGRVYAGSDGTTFGGITAKYVAVWDGNQWAALGPGFDNSVLGLAFTRGGNLLAVGAMTRLADGSISRLPSAAAEWNGSVWRPLGLYNIGSTFNGVACLPNGGYIFGGAITTPGFDMYESVGNSLTFTYNGAATYFPEVTITGPGTVYQLRNLTTNMVIHFRDYSLGVTETVKLTLNPTRLTITSSIYGDVTSRVLPGGDWGRLGLIPGKNNIELLMIPGAGGAIGAFELYYQNRYWGFDGIVETNSNAQ